MNQSKSKVYNAPSRFPSRQRIFTNTNSKEAPERSYDNDMMRMLAKIRQLEDDLNAIRSKNSQIEMQNQQFLKILEQLDYGVQNQQAQLSNLVQGINRQMEAGSIIDRYEQDLKSVSQQIIMLHQILKNKNQKYEILKEQKQQAQYSNRKLKQQSNSLLFNENAVYQQLSSICEHQFDESDSHPSKEQDLDQIINFIMKQCQSLSQQINRKQDEYQRAKKESNETLMSEKQKRIKLEFQMRLLRERKNDFDKKKIFFQQCYNERATQDVIDDMLKKEDNIRRLINQQQQIKKSLIKQYNQILQNQQKLINRQRSNKLQEIKVINMESDVLKGQFSNHYFRLTEAEKRFSTINQQVKMEEYLVLMEDQTVQKVKRIQQENITLQKIKYQLSSQIQFLQKELQS